MKAAQNDFGLAWRKIVGYAPPFEIFWVRHCLDPPVSLCECVEEVLIHVHVHAL